MRAVLVVNPNATTTTVRVRDILVRTLSGEVDLDLAYTQKRGHATDLARDATRDGIELIVALGGDGTVNEVVNGIMTADDGTGTGRAGERPALAAIPGGSTNVFARSVGMPRDWAKGLGAIVEALREGRTRTIGLGRADERYFTFGAGFGMDAAVIQRVERARLRGVTATPMLYMRAIAAQYVVGVRHRRPPIVLERSDAPPEEALASVIVQNTAPWTYLGDRPVHANPHSSFDEGLDVMAVRRLYVPSTARTAGQMLSRRSNPRGRQIVRMHDLEAFTLRSERPMPFQLDGDYLGERDKLDFVSIPKALRVVC